MQKSNSVMRSFEYIDFDPKDKEHLEAFYSLKYEAKQNSKLRFKLEEGYADVPTMMQSKITESYLKSVFTNCTKKDYVMKGY
jgi:hypothetical protein